ncbi:hypothetical protein FOYG_11162 [Fusarium oxysporum NRRL 32931]|uniref:Uncharacterized protein n=1 Tax=Fusarium oxysporum NRRL 32931 TaxID=660029 RepID=W9I0E9_FUSOX|nr:hypothetical protein FOYG_11162 [Fusarium oxysporum NRRL 32931]
MVSCSNIFGFTTPQLELNVRFQTDTHENYPLATVLHGQQRGMALVNTIMNCTRGLSPDTHLILDVHHTASIINHLQRCLFFCLPSHVTMQSNNTNTNHASQFVVAWQSVCQD